MQCQRQAPCRVSYHETTPIGHCECTWRYSGEQCEFDLLGTAQACLQAAFLLLSNTAMLPAILIAHANGLQTEAMIFACCMASSVAHHAADLIAPSRWWSQLAATIDLQLAYLTMFALLWHLVQPSSAPRERIPYALPHMLAYLLLSALVSAGNFMLVVPLLAAAASTRLLHLMYVQTISDPPVTSIPATLLVREHVLATFSHRHLLGTVLLAALAGMAVSMQTQENYWLAHSLWHVLIMSSVVCGIQSKTCCKKTAVAFHELRVP